MRIHYFGHACFLLKDNNFSVIIDPFCDIGYNLVAPKVDYCICSHEHFDHNARFSASMPPTVMASVTTGLVSSPCSRQSRMWAAS